MAEEFIILPINICRICTNLQSNLNILTDKLEDEQVLLHEALEFVSCIRIDFDDGMSRTMCLTCSKRLSEAYKFKNQVLDSYRAFYNQTSDYNFKKEGSIHENDSEITVYVEANSSMDCNEQEEPEMTVKCVNELGINLSTDAVSFLLEHNNFKSKNKKEPLLMDQNRTAEDETASIEQIQTEENEPPPIGNNQTGTIEILSIEINPTNDIESSTITKENKTPPTSNSRILKRNLTSSDCNNSKDEKKILSCDICNKVLPKKSNLRDHLRLHAKEKNFVCSFCQKAFVQIANYRTHLRVHTKERPFKCHLCPKTYSQGGSLKTHIRSHTNERNYICEVCYKGFTNSSDLGKHTRIHDLSRMFACKTCGNLFTQKVNLQVHERNVHCKKANK